jgi:uncharacterized membrane protein YqjE
MTLTRQPAPEAQTEAPPPLGSLLRELADDVSELLSLEVALAKEEMSNEVEKVKETATAGGLAVYFAALTGLLLAFAAAWGLAEVVPEGVAFLIVAFVVGVVAAVLGVRARSRARTIDPVPRETVQTLEEDVQWLSQQTS